MSQEPTDTFHAPIRWDYRGLPHSVAFNDKYFCTDNGYEETLYVSCQGNQLQERFSKLDPQKLGTFTIIETGFGLALSFCTLWQLWDQCAPSSWKLHFISIELYPVAVEDLSRALAIWPMLSDYKEALVAQYQPSEGGVKDFYFERGQVFLTIVFEDVLNALSHIHEKAIAPNGADAWFLNGFAPFKNPKMWSDEVFQKMAPLSRKGTTLSTFTVAGFVRRGLEASGFVVERIKGHGKKKQILTGFFGG